MNDRDIWVPQTGKRYSNYLSRQREKRKSETKSIRSTRAPRSQLTKSQRHAILLKTDSKCHICGGVIKGSKWQADHVVSYSKGGTHSVDNYLPAHSTCNNYRWHYRPEEFQEIMKLGIWVQNQIINKTKIGNEVAERFVQHETIRIKRRAQSK